MMKKILRIALATFVVASLAVGGSILYYNLDRPNGMTYVSIREHDQDAVRHAVLESVREEGFQVVAESEQDDVFQVRNDMDQPLVFNVRIDREADYYKISFAQPRWMGFRSNDRNQMAEACGGLLNRVCKKLGGPGSANGLQSPDIDQLNDSVQELGRSQS